ncbi:MAG: hypothetical protein ACODAJ_14605, partial [Planctomycetota bacterium]
LAFTVILAGVLGWRHPRVEAPWAAALFVFLVLFLAAWAGGVWLMPFGPVLWGSRWLPFVLVGLVVALILLAVGSTVHQPGSSAEAVAQARETAVMGTVFGIVFWALMLCLLAAIVVHYAARVF